MGGIFGYVCPKPRKVNDVIEGLKRLEYRGYNGTGIMFLEDNGTLKIVKQPVKVDEFKLDKELYSTIGIGHTRYASRGWPTYENTHPLLDCSGKIGVVADGIVYDYEKVRVELKQRGHKFVSTTDVEVIPHMLENNSVFETANIIQGLYAFVALFSGKNTIYAVQMGQPLVIGLGEDNCYFVSSDIQSLNGYANEVLLIPDYTLVEISPSGIKAVNVISGEEVELKERKRVKPFPGGEKAGFPHYMLKEIYEVPDALISTNLSILEKYLRLSSMILYGAKNIYIIGNGTSLHAGMIGSYYLLQNGISANVISAAEFPYYALNNVTTGTVILAISQSGETSDVIKSVKLAKQRGAVIIGVTNYVGSRLALESNVYLPITAGPEMAVPATKTFTSTILALLELAYYVGLNTGRKQQSDINRLNDEVKSLSKRMKDKIKDMENQADVSASQVYTWNDFYVTSSGLTYPLALEGALKLKEAAGIHAEGFQSGELMHGPLTLATKGLPVIFIRPVEESAQELFYKVLDNSKEKGAKVIVIDVDNEEIRDALKINTIKTINELMPISHAVGLQLLAYKLGVKRDMPVDTPPALVKAVIY